MLRVNINQDQQLIKVCAKTLINPNKEKITTLKNKIPFEDKAGKKNVISVRVDGIKQLWLQDPDRYWIEINDAKF